MEYSRSGPLMQVMIFQALDQFSSGVLASPEGSLRNAIVSEEAWRACAKEIQQTLSKHLLEQ
ncbi:hypothetical protein B0B16_04360 [Pseudomonas aeruginosa]|nr:hypothetical protein YH69_11830 [Pseudomonas aeruginosa]AKG02846.1 hypothetical protein YH69_12710 [Pseudomonas aeruginosa]AKG02955.1 hypothetical protein YH69_27775 [Pseudomonas aeruginosa]OOH54244.1 hypothetical protein B0B27_03155 [Pseudomonas aeruginosa]OOH56471.1 hypothetical protein B0B16_04360 [Pseudomonas aeruginosa]